MTPKDTVEIFVYSLVNYRVLVVSWENDADNYRTKSVDGLTEIEVQFIYKILAPLKSKRKGGKWGNMFEPTQFEIENFTRDMIVIAQQNIDIAAEMLELEDFEIKEFREYTDETEINTDDYTHIFTEFLDDYMGSSEFFTRIVEKITVEFTPVDIFIDDVTEKFI